MRLILCTTIVALGGLGCGGSKPAAQAEAATAAAAQAAPAAPAASAAPVASAGPEAQGKVVEVKMAGNGTTMAAFVPAALTITPGTTVRFINVSGGPHNIAFYADSIPKGGAETLKKGMSNAMADLMGPFVQQPNEKYDVSFAGAPKGVYKGFCMPHVALGMKITITVR